MSNIIRIKRRLPDSGLGLALPSLSGGEIAFNEINTTLYYGASSSSGTSSIAIGGAGTFATNTLVDSLTSNLQTQLNNLGSGSTTAIDNLSSHVDTYFVEKIESDAVTLNGGLTVAAGLNTDTLDATGNASIGGDLTITGSLSVLGTQVIVNTETINISGTSTQIDVVNNGTGTGITVNQIGDQDVAEFKDDGATAFIIKDGGNVGIGTATPNEKLTVSGNLSASGNVYAVNGDFTGTLDVDSTATLGSTLDVTGAATFASSVSAAGAVDFDSTLDVVGATTLQSTLDVTGATVINNSLSATGAVEFDSTLTVDGVVTINNNLVVTGTSSLDNGSITTDGSGTITGTIDQSQIVNFIIDGGSF